MDLRHFRYFVAVAEELHFSRAAQRLHIGQPPLSLQIQAIERELGTELLKRSRRRVALTEAGRLFLGEARAALAAADRAIETAKRAGRGEIGTLRVSFTASAPFTRAFTRAVRAYRLALPDVHLALRLSTSEQIVEAVRSGDVDVGWIRPAATMALPADIAALPVLQDRLMLTVNADHPLARSERPVALEALAQEAFVLRPRGPGAAFYEQVFELCAAAGFAPRVVQEAAEAPTILGLVAAGVGLSVLPASFRAIRIEDVVWRELAVGAAATSAMLLIYKAEGEDTPRRARFIELIRRAAARGKPPPPRRTA